MKEKNYSRKNIIPGVIFMVLLAFALYNIIQYVMPLGVESDYIKPGGEILAGVVEGNFLDRLSWSIMDWTQGSFLGLLPSSIGMLVFSLVGAHLERKNSKYKGTGIDGTGQIFTRIAIGATVGSFLNMYVWSSLLKNGWSVSFAPYLTIVSLIMFYGADAKKIVTIVLTSVLLAFPMGHYSMVYITSPLKLPAYVAVSIGLIVMIPIANFIFGFMPWMKKEEPEQIKEIVEEADAKEDVDKTEVIPTQEVDSSNIVAKESIYFIHRVFGDYGELNFWGSSYAGMAMIAGIILTLYVSSGQAAPNVDVLVLSQLLTAILSIFIYYNEWKEIGWSYTFGSMLFTSAIVASYPNTATILIPTIIIGAAACPYVNRKVIEITKLGDTLPAIFFTLVGVGSLVAIWSFIVMGVLI